MASSLYAEFARAGQLTSDLWPTPDLVVSAERYPSSEGDAAQEMICIMDAVPLGTNLTRFDWACLASQAAHEAETAYLARLADW